MRNYKRNFKHKIYEPSFVRMVLRALEDGRSMASVSQLYGVPKPTLHSWKKAKEEDKPICVLVGRRPVLASEEEDLLVTALEYTALCGFPFDRSDIAETVKGFIAYTGRKNPFGPDSRPSSDWLGAFLRRHRGRIRPRKQEILTSSRAKALSEEVCEHFHHMYQENIEKFGITHDGIFNLDEIGLAVDPMSEKVLVLKKVGIHACPVPRL